MKFGLIGKSLKHSFSKDYFQKKFREESLSHNYHNFELSKIDEFNSLLEENSNLKGLNVTIPYKEEIIPYLDRISNEARTVGAVNTIKVTSSGLEGYNTDVYGFYESLQPLLQDHYRKALILGTGGASKAIVYALGQLNIEYTLVSRKPDPNQLDYEEASQLLGQYQIIINTTPLGTFPNVSEQVPLDLELLNSRHLVYDLIYNPSKTALLKESEKRGATIKNGLEMLQLQANKSWLIWNES